ncbi:ribosome biogenesis GTP-binding protein YihA/YsxC [Lactobacillus iners]|jgi:ribosome biogenesis GTP-binding protein ysxC|uniref:Probable GTP-binding protein EngB n=2 Tax=Lactobacillus iners TaxID=147802 RepID=C8PAS3_9LACO|nr:ribosome biogenesis GTP-binding protein YihA/YsxC [Lactobacillus iners]EEW52562.1 ribosome biogenesis GTP-binding protein YsxC [Lactobacillus iners DSM 13335]EFQ47419.1 ribosome biogenesis GTP-binding protein YsxC [Lactobacillus iners LEAF 2053A-b]EFQ50469.1 ribosome biogenesis GTP-binding protein YsxC [Lactobacillus iners LEAF 2062A-h1]EFQ51416.1 ribosome biogenesis GTP-binding protein YsxC [Lactobacillus iners LEAF 3008A-a]EGC81011.1 ribosome biogenesis GTP-binding protein YsxC [Lactobaci
MKVNNSKFVISAVSDKQYPQDDLPEIALSGRSNVGKSSLINAVLNRRNLARTSQQPGKTQTLNFYLVNTDLYFVDVPGYGYAKVSKEQRQKFGEMIQDYLETRADLKGLVLLVDARHDPTVDDINMFNYALCLNIPILVVATKIDKLKKSAIGQLESKIGLSLDLTQSQVTFLPFSSETKINIDKFWKWIENSIK